MNSIDIEASIAQIRQREYETEEQVHDACSSTCRAPDSGPNAKKPEMQGALYSEQPGLEVDSMDDDQMRFFGTASGRLDLQPSRPAIDASTPDHESNQTPSESTQRHLFTLI